MHYQRCHRKGPKRKSQLTIKNTTAYDQVNLPRAHSPMCSGRPARRVCPLEPNRKGDLHRHCLLGTASDKSSRQQSTKRQKWNHLKDVSKLRLRESLRSLWVLATLPNLSKTQVTSQCLRFKPRHRLFQHHRDRILQPYRLRSRAAYRPRQQMLEVLASTVAISRALTTTPPGFPENQSRPKM